MDPIDSRIDRLERANELARHAARDLRYGLRGLRRHLGFTLIAVATLALGIGANTAIFTWVQAELLAALPYHDASQLVALREYANGRTVADTYPDFLDWQRDQTRAFAGMAWHQDLGFNLSGAGAPEVANGADVSSNYFPLLGVAPRAGRLFAPLAAEAVISQKLALRQFGSVAAAVGARLDLSDAAFTVVGVLPPDFKDANQSDVFVPAERTMRDHPDRNDRGSHNDALVVARLAPGVTLAAALTAQKAEMARLGRAYPETNSDEGAVVAPLRDDFVGNDAPMLWLLMASVGLVLLIACANVAGLMLVRTSSRQQEWAVRSALGASRGRLLRQLLAESLVLALLGGAAGVGVAALALRALQTLTTAVTLQLNWPVLAFTAGLCAVAAILFGLAPARQAGRLASATRVTAPLRARNLLVAGEVALALLLAIAAGLMIESFARLMAVSPGFQAQQVLDFETNFAGPRYAKDATVLAAQQSVLARLQAIPGVSVAAIGSNVPLMGNHDRGDVTIAGQPLPSHGHFPHPDYHYISPGYLGALGLPLVRGRDFNDGDTATSAKVALVSATFARTYWPGLDPVGRQFWNGHPAAGNHDLETVVGVVGDTKNYGLRNPARIEIYEPYTQYPSSSPDFLLRTSLPPLTLATAATAALHAVDRTLPAVQPQTMEQIVAASVSNPRTTMWMLGIFGALALLLAMLGIYGVVSYATEQRTRELGVRIALGASPGALAALVLGTSLRWIALGMTVGLAGALALGRLLSSQLFGVTAADPQVFVLATLLLALVGLAASAMPIRRALRVDPQAALRCE